MKNKILLIIFFIICNPAFSQTLLTPLKSNSFGLNHHTNRDIAYFSHVDTNGNSIIVGTTEKDSTFTDILATKLDQDFNLVWEKRVSIATNLSYDIPLKSFINSDNELYIIGRSSFNESSSNGLIFVIKYSENGSIIYNKTIGNIDGSDYDDYGYMDVMLNDDGSLSLVYEPHIYQTYVGNVYYFLKIDNQGDIISSFTKKIQHQGITGKIDSENFYFLVKEILDENNYTFIYKFYKIQSENIQSNIEITDSNFINYYKNSVFSDQAIITVDADSNCYLTCHNISDNDTKEKIHFSKIGNDNEMKYSLTTSDSDNYYLIGAFINNQNDNIVVANNINNNSIDFINVDENNTTQTITNSSNIIATGFKKNDDGSFFITTSNANIRLFSNELIELKSFDTSNSFELIDFSKIDENTITTAGIKYDKMFPESDYSTQLDIQVEKINSSQVVNNYLYSGIGTSRAFQQRVIIDNDNNYLVFVTEKMGPEYLGIGGQNPPLNNRIIKYNSNLEILWEAEFPDSILNIVNNGGRDIKYYLDTNNDLYLNLPKVRDIYNVDYDLYKISSTGNIEFINNSYIPDKFFANEMNIFIANNRFSSADDSTIYKLDKNTGNLLEEINLGSEIVLEFFSIGTDNYFYSYDQFSNNTPDVIYLYRNGEKIFTRNLATNYGIFPFEINEEGTLFFVTNYASDHRLNKLDINNSYNYYNTSTDIDAFKNFNNGNVFLYLDNYNTLILDKNLNLIASGEDLNSWNPYLMTWENYILFGTGFENSIRVIDQNGVVINYFKIKGFLHDWYSKFDDQGNLIMVGQFGNRIYTFNQYGWYRGFIHNYGTLDMVLSNEDVDFNNQEKDFIIYPNPTSGVLNIDIPNNHIEKVILYNIHGKYLKNFNKNNIDLSNLNSGIYFIKIFTSSNSVINSKVIKN